MIDSIAYLREHWFGEKGRFTPLPAANGVTAQADVASYHLDAANKALMPSNAVEARKALSGKIESDDQRKRIDTDVKEIKQRGSLAVESHISLLKSEYENSEKLAMEKISAHKKVVDKLKNDSNNTALLKDRDELEADILAIVKQQDAIVYKSAKLGEKGLLGKFAESKSLAFVMGLGNVLMLPLMVGPMIAQMVRKPPPPPSSQNGYASPAA